MSKKRKIVPGICVALAVVVLAVVCRNKALKEQKNDTYVQAMNTLMTLTAYGPHGEAGLEAAEHRIMEIEEIFSVTDEDSEVYRINQREENTVAVSEELTGVLGQAIAFGVRSGGAFDITMYPVTRLWGFTEEEHHVPSDAEIAESLGKVGYERLHLDADSNLLTLEDGMEIDFGAMAKGYAADEVISVLRESGVDSAIISLGGNIQTLGTKPDGSSWKVAIKDPENPENYLGAVEVGEKAVVTSGGYERYFEDEDGNIWWHIMDPDTGYSAKNGLISVTIISDSGTLSDVLSTMLFVKGLDGAVEDWRTYGDYEAVLVAENGEIYVTEGIYDDFTPADKSDTVIKIQAE